MMFALYHILYKIFCSKLWQSYKRWSRNIICSPSSVSWEAWTFNMEPCFHVWWSL